MDTQQGPASAEKKTRLWGIVRKPVRPISLVIGMLAMLAITLGVIAIAGSSGNVQAEHVEIFTQRAPVDPYRINQPPHFMVHSRARTDIVMQRLEFAPGPGGWHTHLGPSFGIVAEGRLKLTRFTEKDGCVETDWFGPGEAAGQVFFEVGNEVHRPTFEGDLNSGKVVVHLTRFNIPVGGAISTPAEDPEGPGCPDPE